MRCRIYLLILLAIKDSACSCILCWIEQAIVCEWDTTASKHCKDITFMCKGDILPILQLDKEVIVDLRHKF
jgi:hypothetical protein